MYRSSDGCSSEEPEVEATWSIPVVAKDQAWREFRCVAAPTSKYFAGLRVVANIPLLCFGFKRIMEVRITNYECVSNYARLQKWGVPFSMSSLIMHVESARQLDAAASACVMDRCYVDIAIRGLTRLTSDNAGPDSKLKTQPQGRRISGPRSREPRRSPHPNLPCLIAALLGRPASSSTSHEPFLSVCKSSAINSHLINAGLSS
jgi:hypothetical protein